MPGTIEEAGIHRLGPETDESGRVTIPNKYAIKITLKQTYGQRLSPEQKKRIDVWIQRLPYDWQLEDANTPCLATVTLYEDWLDWSKPRALSWLTKLDKFERRFRIAGVAYHKIPYALRHSSTLTHSSKIEQIVLSRLSKVFEVDRPRSQQTFFRPWNEIFSAVDEVLQKLRTRDTAIKDADQLRILESEIEVTLSQLAKPQRNLEAGLVWVEEQVAKLTERSDLDGSENLAAEHSREGGLFRMWIQTFSNSEHGEVQSKSAYTEAFVDEVMGDKGVIHDAYWSKLAVGDDEVC